ncbi:hypothetical protein BGY98DRAFT_307515 [Russula aff. rugulosa BPL654]|nr:hypothetical protein BGY98DRAFT_307515 [Russula aff. rugulosa BPL654]
MLRQPEPLSRHAHNFTVNHRQSLHSLALIISILPELTCATHCRATRCQCVCMKMGNEVFYFTSFLFFASARL